MSWQFTVGLSVKGKSDRIAVRAEDALIAALKVKSERPLRVMSRLCQNPRALLLSTSKQTSDLGMSAMRPKPDGMTSYS